MYFKNWSWVIVVYDISDFKSFEWIDQWILCASPHLPEGWVKILWGNKLDLTSERTVTTEEGMSKAEEYNMYFYETSAKEGVNIDEMFETTAKEMKVRKDNGTLTTGFMRNSFHLQESESFQLKKKKCW